MCTRLKNITHHSFTWPHDSRLNKKTLHFVKKRGPTFSGKQASSSDFLRGKIAGEEAALYFHNSVPESSEFNPQASWYFLPKQDTFLRAINVWMVCNSPCNIVIKTALKKNQFAHMFSVLTVIGMTWSKKDLHNLETRKVNYCNIKVRWWSPFLRTVFFVERRNTPTLFRQRMVCSWKRSNNRPTKVPA